MHYRRNLHIQATHYYVRFVPLDSAEYEILKDNTTIDLFNTPLDCHLTEGEYFVDKNNLGYGCFYTRVPIDYDFGIFNHEILDELYLPMVDEVGDETDNEPQYTKAKGTSENEMWETLENRSLELTGNIPNNDTSKDKNTKAKWYPCATIKAYDDEVGALIPLEGVKVRARNWFNWETAYTNKDGFCRMPDDFKNTTFSIVWEGAHWDIRHGVFGQATYKGPDDTKKDWVFNIYSGLTKAYAHVHRAVYTMTYKNPVGAGIRKPQNYNKLKIAVCDKNKEMFSGININFSFLGINPQIYVYTRNSSDNYRSSEEMFSTTVHEIAHTTHARDCEFSPGFELYLNVKGIIYESWATYIEWAVVSWEYARLGKPMKDEYDNDYQTQFWFLQTKSNPKYSPVFIDLADTYNQGSHSNSKEEYPEDKVSGFTVAELRGIINKVQNMQDLKVQVKSLRKDPVVLSNIDKLFSTYEKF